MSDYNQLNGAELDRYITGNYGEDQFKGLIDCPSCEGSGEAVKDECLCHTAVRGDDCYYPCSRCDGEGYIEGFEDPGDDPDRKYDEERDRRMLDIDVPDEVTD